MGVFELSRQLLVLFVSFLTVLIAGTSSVFAQENMLKGIEVSQEGGTYVLTLKTTGKAPYKKSIDSNDSVYFDLKNMLSTQNVETFYNDVDDIDGVVVQQLENDRLRIYVNGENTKDTKIVFDTAVEGANEIVINKPISEYAPVSPQVLEEDSNWGENSFNLEYLLGSVFKKISSVKIDFMFILCAIAILGTLVGMKSFLSKVRAQQEPLIGIAHTNGKIADYDFEDEEQNNLIEPDFYHEEAQPRIQSLRYDTAPKRPMRAQGAPARATAPQAQMRNYGLNTYQKSQGNPYSAASAQKPYANTPQTAPTQKHFTTSPVQRARTQAGAPTGTPVAQQRQRSAAPRATHIDSIKFLESVTKIYEQNGRKDLASGLKASLDKSKSKIAM